MCNPHHEECPLDVEKRLDNEWPGNCYFFSCSGAQRENAHLTRASFSSQHLTKETKKQRKIQVSEPQMTQQGKTICCAKVRDLSWNPGFYSSTMEGHS